MKANKLGIKAIILTVVCVLMITIGATPANAVSVQKNVVVYKADFHFVVDGKVYHAPKDTQGFLYNNRTYVPVRFASYMLEKWVEWNQATSTVSVKLPSENQLKQLQNYKKQYLMPNVDVKKPASSLKKETIYALVDAAGYNFFGREQAIPEDVTTFMHKGTLYVPLRYFAELIQHDISYNSATKTITMNARNDSDNGNNGTDGTPTNPGTGNSGDNTGEGVIPGAPGEITPPTRAELVSAAEAQLKRMEASLVNRAYSLYSKYEKASTDEEKLMYLAEGSQAVKEADEQVKAIVDQLNKDLAKYDYEIGNDAENLQKTYEAKKQEMFARFL
ncbi:stalk domain-containing protein [Paenibacillus septentrionalis]|uniref:Stalk domain-containing protein n=1 Tax=Paenibacillus septentrionalis TaxID=429342 RepID=A0ABW1V8L8_9BACL